MTGRARAARLALAGITADPAPVDLYVLAGQSNMSGRGDLAALTAAERIADPCIRSYGNDDRGRLALDPLDDTAGQVDAFRRDLKPPRLPVAVVQLANRPRGEAELYAGWISIRDQPARPLGPCIAMVRLRSDGCE